MRKCRRTMSITMALFLAVSMLSACGSTTATASSDPAPVVVQQEVQPAEEAAKPAEEASEVKEESAPTAESAPEVIDVVEETPVHVPPTIITTTELTDVDGTQFPLDVKRCVELGIMRPDADGTFHLNDTVTKAQVAEAMYNFFDHSNYVIPKDLVLDDVPRETSEPLTKITDINPDACYWLADTLGSWVVEDEKFDPQKQMTEAEVVDDILYPMTALTDRPLGSGALAGDPVPMTREVAAYAFAILGMNRPVGTSLLGRYDQNKDIVLTTPQRTPASPAQVEEIVENDHQRILASARSYGYTSEDLWDTTPKEASNGTPGIKFDLRLSGPKYQMVIIGWDLAYVDGVSGSYGVAVYEYNTLCFQSDFSETEVVQYFELYSNN